MPTSGVVHDVITKAFRMVTGKYFSKFLILASVNPQYDERLFIELQEKYNFRTFFAEFNEQYLVILWVN